MSFIGKPLERIEDLRLAVQRSKHYRTREARA